MTNLPSLTCEPTRYPGCCLSLSAPLLATISTLLASAPHPRNKSHHDGYKPLEPEPEPEPALVLSIGSGTGLLEQLLDDYLNHDHRASLSSNSARNWRVEGVEVNPAVNIYLPEDRINHVLGTWAVLETRAREAAALMFVYPRDGALVRRYIDAFMTFSTCPGGGRRVNCDSESGPESDGGFRSTVESSNEAVTSGNPGGDSHDIRRNPCRGVRLVLWLGPKCDWNDTGLGAFQPDDEFEVLEMRHHVGLAEYEMVAALRQKITLT
ncbi:hypothetical protein F4859DRAFT_274989 [Xylaria cf. heliscus]|nr:hypothetical protein F4859DRAFT_274989 [Xylaria cf. heliscus]